MSEERPRRRITVGRILLAAVFAGVSIWIYDTFILPKLLGDRTLCGHSRSVDCLAFSPDGGRLFSGGYDGKVIAWDMENLESTTLINVAPHPVEALAVSSDGSLLAIAADFDRIVLDRGEEGGHSQGQKRVIALDLRTGKQVAELRNPLDWVGGLAFAPGRPELYVAEVSGRLTIWDTRDWTLKRQTAVHSEGICGGFAVSHPGTLIAARDWTSVQFYNPHLQPTVSFPAESWKGNKMTLAPDGKTLALASRDTFQLIDLSDNSVIHTLPAPDQARTVAFSPDGRLVGGTSVSGIITLGYSGRLRVWRTDNGEQVLSRKRWNAFTAIAFSSDGKLIAAAQVNGGILLIRVPAP
jgi:WD40 repeat protein